MDELDYKRQLSVARGSALSQTQEAVNTARTIASTATPLGAISLGKNIEWRIDWLYGLALMSAILKDILDYIGIGSLPAIGTVITICVTILIGFLMLLAGAGEKNKIAKGLMKRFLTLMAGGGVEGFLFGVNLLPIETITVLVIYFLVLADRKAAAEEAAKQSVPQEDYGEAYAEA